jgi:hypothetical protein
MDKKQEKPDAPSISELKNDKVHCSSNPKKAPKLFPSFQIRRDDDEPHNHKSS